MAKKFTFETVFKAIDKFSGPITKADKRFTKFVKGAMKGLRGIKKLTKSVGKSLLTMTKFGAGAAAGIAVTTTLVNKNTVALERQAKAVGVSATFIEGVTKQLASAGFESETVVDLIEEMNNKFGESTSVEEMIAVKESMHALGLEFSAIKNLSPEKQFLAINDAAIKLARTGNKGFQQAVFAVDSLMGGEANKSLGILVEGNKFLAERVKLTEEQNFQTDRSRKGARMFVDSLGDVAFIVKTVTRLASGLIGEALDPLLKRFRDWALANKEITQTKIVEFVDGLIAKITEMLKAFDAWRNDDGFEKMIQQAEDLVSSIVAIGGAVKDVGEFFAGDNPRMIGPNRQQKKSQEVRNRAFTAGAARDPLKSTNTNTTATQEVVVKNEKGEVFFDSRGRKRQRGLTVLPTGG